MRKKTSLEFIEIDDKIHEDGGEGIPFQSSSSLRKPALKPFNERLTSQKQIGEKKQQGTEKSIKDQPCKSSKSIKFRETKEYQQFTYTKGETDPKPGSKHKERDRDRQNEEPQQRGQSRGSKSGRAKQKRNKIGTLSHTELERGDEECCIIM